MTTKPRGILIAGNWKMNNGPQATERFFTDLKAKAAGWTEGQLALFKSGRLQAWIIPPAVSLAKALEMGRASPFSVVVASQNGHWEKSGAFTGELSAPLLQEIGLERVLIGHSERRQYFGETDETVRKRTEGLLAQGLRVMVCFGETRAERESGQTQAVLEKQLGAIFPEKGKGAASYLDGRLVLAYEPVWAIGTGLTATPAQAEEAHVVCRKFLAARCGSEAAERTPILYGGSVTPETAEALLSCPNIDGGLVGGASLKPDSYAALLVAAAKVLGT